MDAEGICTESGRLPFGDERSSASLAECVWNWNSGEKGSILR